MLPKKNSQRKVKTIRDCLRAIPHAVPTQEALILLSSILGTSPEYCIAHDDEPVPYLARVRFRLHLGTRARGVPLAYLVGHKAFFGLDFLVNRHTLVPRPDTEVLVETALHDIRKQVASDNMAAIIDVGTGSGCIPIALLHSLTVSERERVEVIATDLSRGALRVARKNARHHHTPIAFLHGNLLYPIIKTHTLPSIGHSLFLTANLPYLTKQQFDEEPSIQHEPYSALVAENDGLALYEELLQQAQQLIGANRHVTIRCYFEIDPRQSTRISTLVHKYFRAASLEIKKDLAGQDRVVAVTIKTSVQQ